MAESQHDPAATYSHRLAAAQLVTSRLERLSVDSYWAHRASGLRGSLLRCLERLESAPPGSPSLADELARLEQLIQLAYQILARAAGEIRVPDNRH
jgi:hypothetical protein